MAGERPFFRIRSAVTSVVSVGALLAVALTVMPPSAVGASGQAADPDPSRTTIFESGSYLTEPSEAPPGVIALRYARKHREAFNLSQQAASALRVTSVVTTEHDGAHHVVLGQRVQSLPVHGATLTALVDRDGRLVLVGGRTAETETSGATRLSAGQAISVAAERAGAEDARPPKGSNTKAPGKHSFKNPYAKGLHKPSPVTAELVWYLQDDRSLRMAWLTDVEVSDESWEETVVDATTGAVLASESRYSHSGPEGNVIQEQHPDMPGAAQQITPFTGINGTWVSGTTTSGNNVDAYLDRDNNNSNDEYQPTNADQHFDYTFTDAWRTTADGTSAAALDADRDPVITQLFYYTNDMHDWLWGFGFDEASGNFQVTNVSGDGTGGDPVLAEAQDGYAFGCDDGDATPNEHPDDRCRNNAFFGTGADGTTARMQMYMWIPGRPFRDGSMDGDVIAHEYGHGVSNRLVPGTLSGATNQAGSLGEGWSDALSFLRWGDTTVGEYVTGNTNRGIRSSAYDTHPDTYGDYSLSVISPHRNGEIWAATLYDVRELLGINTTTQLMLDGMRSTPNGPSPTFLNARDGILAADMASNAGANQCALWTAFAGRGMGQDAASNGLHAVPTEDFTVPAQCLPSADANGPYLTPEGTDQVLDGSGSAPGSDSSAGAIASYEWDLDNDGQYDDATGVTPTFTDVGFRGLRTIGLRVTDEFGNTDTASSTVDVANVAPSVSVDPIVAIDEGGVVTVSGVVSDPGWETDLSATIDFDDGLGAQPLTGVEENVRPNATLSFSVEHQYGDNGTFTVAVTGDDGLAATSASADAVVHNVVPTTTIDTSGEQTYDGVSATVLPAGHDVTIGVNATDPGSDDLTFEWLWDDGTSDAQTSRVNPPLPDPAKSPSVQPRDVTLDATHAYADACVYELQSTVTDDDGGIGSDTASIIVTGNADTSKGHGWWFAQYREQPPNDFTPATLQCYLDIAVFFSLVFNDPLTRADGEEILRAPAKAPATVQFDEKALAAWLNFANGAITFDTLVDTDGDGTADTTFGDAMLTAESVRIDPNATDADIREQRDILERIILRDE